VLAAGKLSGKVISTGGGVVVNDDNFDALKQNGTIIFLNRSTSYLPTDGRPLSQSNDLNEMLKKRLPLYRKFCDIEADGNSTIENVANNILKELQNENTCN
jgi:shikimate dehydrogenase